MKPKPAKDIRLIVSYETKETDYGVTPLLSVELETNEEQYTVRRRIAPDDPNFAYEVTKCLQTVAEILGG